MATFTLRKGDKCWVQLNKKHYGVFTGYGADGQPWFVHNTRGSGVVHETRKGFAGNHPIYIEQRAPLGQEESVVQRAFALVGRGYDMLAFNCEHVANYALNQKAESKQVQQGVVAAALVGLGTFFVTVLAVASGGTSVDDNGYRRYANGQFAPRRRW
jgi:hypothetical protein